MLNESDKSFLIEALDFWDKLTSQDQSEIIANTISISYKSGTCIHSAATECIGVLVVKSGELRTYILSDEGKEVTLYRLNRGDVCVMSASCLLKSITFDVHINAEQDSEVLLISFAVFSKLIEKNIYVEAFSLRVAASKFSTVMWAMEQILFMSFDRRLATFLLEESDRTKLDTINLTQEQIAKYMGSAREVVSRMIKYFVKENIVETYRGGLKLIDKQKLRNLI